jgi:hypothetical protein
MASSKGASDDHVNLQDRLVVKSTVAARPAVGEEVGVQLLQMVGAQVSEWDTADVGHDVEIDVASVAVPGGRAKREPLGGQPPLGQVDPDGETVAGADVATKMLAGERGGQLLGVEATASSGMPTATFPTGDRIDALVDDRVVAVALASDVSLHDVDPPLGRRLAGR